MRRILLALVLSGALPAAACEDADGPFDARALRIRLVAERAAWEEAEPAAYAYELRRGCFCPPDIVARALVEVEAGVTVEATYLEPVHGSDPRPAGSPVPEEVLPFYGPVEDLFDMVESALDTGAATVEVDFHPAFHYPTSILIVHCDPACADDGTTVEAAALAPRFGD